MDLTISTISSTKFSPPHSTILDITLGVSSQIAPQSVKRGIAEEAVNLLPLFNPARRDSHRNQPDSHTPDNHIPGESANLRDGFEFLNHCSLCSCMSVWPPRRSTGRCRYQNNWKRKTGLGPKILNSSKSLGMFQYQGPRTAAKVKLIKDPRLFSKRIARIAVRGVQIP